mmetsp:Transcript_29713/g.57921  ORF Transcript_29713/g.57921 Transcript_29713/m.57921 type:complete len:232 (+) Transcript_29713:1817-2512(+)
MNWRKRWRCLSKKRINRPRLPTSRRQEDGKTKQVPAIKTPKLIPKRKRKRKRLNQKRKRAKPQRKIKIVMTRATLRLLTVDNRNQKLPNPNPMRNRNPNRRCPLRHLRSNIHRNPQIPRLLLYRNPQNQSHVQILASRPHKMRPMLLLHLLGFLAPALFAQSSFPNPRLNALFVTHRFPGQKNGRAPRVPSKTVRPEPCVRCVKRPNQRVLSMHPQLRRLSPVQPTVDPYH